MLGFRVGSVVLVPQGQAYRMENVWGRERTEELASVDPAGELDKQGETGPTNSLALPLALHAIGPLLRCLLPRFPCLCQRENVLSVMGCRGP